MTHTNAYMDAQILWDYMLLHEPTGPADMLLVLGSIDESVAIRAAELSNVHNYDQVCFTGGIAHTEDLLRVSWTEPEAEHFYQVFLASNGRAQNLLLETRAQNTGENAKFVYSMLERDADVIPRSIQIVTKPYMERRARATFEVQWPSRHTTFSVTSPQLLFADYYHSSTRSQNRLINIMAGDFQRIMKYPDLGFQSRQEIPPEVFGAWERLVASGFNEHIVST